MLLSALRHPIETARTAPFGSSIIASGVSAASPNAIEMVTNPSITEAVGIMSGVPSMLIGATLVARQLKLRQRVERVSERGFDERFLEPTTSEWCARQTVRTALRKTEFLANYKQLCEERRSTAQLNWLPHF